MSSCAPLTVDAIAAEVARLLNLHEGPEALPNIIGLGEGAIAPLEAVLRGPSQALHHSRCWAADALAAIDGPMARECLLRALHDSVTRNPPAQAREAEDTVVSCIAEHLGNSPDSEVVDALLSALHLRPYPGCVRALARSRDPRAIPLLVRSLFEDATRGAAMEALRRMGPRAVPALAAALGAIPNLNDLEPPTHIDGRAAAATVLGTWVAEEQRLVEDHRVLLQRALGAAVHDRQRSVRVAAALSVIRGSSGFRPAIRVLVRALDDPDWRRATPIVHALVRLGGRIESPLLEAITAKSTTERVDRRRRRAIWIAGQLGTPRVTEVLSTLSPPGGAPVRLAIVTALDRIASANSAVLQRYLEDPDAAVRRQALHALQRRLALSVERAVLLMGDRDLGIRKLAAATLREQPALARAALGQAVISFGMSLHGWRARLRLSWNAMRWLANSARRRALH